MWDNLPCTSGSVWPEAIVVGELSLARCSSLKTADNKRKDSA